MRSPVTPKLRKSHTGQGPWTGRALQWSVVPVKACRHAPNRAACSVARGLREQVGGHFPGRGSACGTHSVSNLSSDVPAAPGYGQALLRLPRLLSWWRPCPSALTLYLTGLMLNVQKVTIFLLCQHLLEMLAFVLLTAIIIFQYHSKTFD